ncbi:MAG TPA: YraN family protein [Acidimicrobiales bacterium]|jgi:putative endonuclease
MDHRPDLRNLARGRAGEETAAAWYRRRGYTIVARNWHHESGEIDLLCRRGGVLVVCEVKARRTDRLGAPLEAVTRGKQHRLRRLAAAYLQTAPGGYDEIRFDVASILGSALTVVEGAF